MRLLRVPLLLFSIAVCAFCDTDHITWVNSNGTIWNSYYTSPYYATSSNLAATLTLFCLDYNDEIAPPFDWDANVYALNQSNVNDYAQFGGNYPNAHITAPPFQFIDDTEGCLYVPPRRRRHDSPTPAISRRPGCFPIFWTLRLRTPQTYPP